MKKLFIIIIILVLCSVIVSAKLNEETLKSVEALRLKQCLDSGTLFYSDISDANFVYEWWSMTFKDGKLFVETQDGKWFIEMKEVEENDKTKNK